MDTHPFFMKHKDYSITINPSDKYQYYGKITRLQLFKSFMHEQILHWKSRGITYTLWIEVSEPLNKTVNGPRLHLHGIIRFHSGKAVLNFLIGEIYKITRYAVYDIDTIDDMEKWIGYCMKQQHIIKITPLSNVVAIPLNV